MKDIAVVFDVCLQLLLHVSYHNSGYKTTPKIIPNLILTELSVLVFGNNEHRCFICLSISSPFSGIRVRPRHL